jgi:hypothetical protein
MKKEMHAARTPIGTIVARGSCAICLALREFQTDLVKNLKPDDCKRFCNPHAWLVANSTPAESVATIFLRSLADPEWRAGAPVPDQCDVCRRMHAEKELRLNEMVEQLRDPKLRSWLHDYGMLCARHGREIVTKVPEDLRKSIQELIARNASELAELLVELLEQVRKGNRAGGGILGHAAEFLVAQRGIES